MRYSLERKADPFKVYVHSSGSRARNKGIDFDITPGYLKGVWEDQGGKCRYTGIRLKHPKGKKPVKQFKLASLDRIDSSEGYIQGNVQFVSLTCNLAKSTLSHEEFEEFLEVVRCHRS